MSWRTAWRDGLSRALSTKVCYSQSEGISHGETVPRRIQSSWDSAEETLKSQWLDSSQAAFMTSRDILAIVTDSMASPTMMSVCGRELPLLYTYRYPGCGKWEESSKEKHEVHEQCGWETVCLHGVSLVDQWLRVRLPMWRTRVQSLVWEDPTQHGTIKPVPIPTEPTLGSLCSTREATTVRRRTPQLEDSPHAPQLERAHMPWEGPSAAKDRQIIVQLMQKGHMPREGPSAAKSK